MHCDVCNYIDSLLTIFRAVATKLAQLHMVDMDTISLVDLEGKVCRFDMSEAMEEKLRQMATHVPDSLQDAEKNVMWAVSKRMQV